MVHGPRLMAGLVKTQGCLWLENNLRLVNGLQTLPLRRQIEDAIIAIVQPSFAVGTFCMIFGCI